MTPVRIARFAWTLAVACLIAGCSTSPSVNGPLQSPRDQKVSFCEPKLPGDQIFSALGTMSLPAGQEATITSVALLNPDQLTLDKALSVPILETNLPGEGFSYPFTPQFIATSKKGGADLSRSRPAIGTIIRTQPWDVIVVVHADSARGTASGILVTYVFDGGTFVDEFQPHIALSTRC